MEKEGKYQIGLDLGVGSVGWAVVDDDDRLIRKKGKNLWGVRLFDEAKTSADRRTKRRQRRTIGKRTWRLNLLKEELKNYVLKEDQNFYTKIKNSQTKPENNDYFLFNGKFNDVVYHREFPTVYHLRIALMDLKKVKAYKERGIYYRLLFLAVNDILKTRGNFLHTGEFNFGTTTNASSIIKLTEETVDCVNEICDDKLDSVFIKEAISEKLKNNDTINKRKKDANTIFLKAVLGHKANINDLLEFSDEKHEINFSDENWEEQLTEIDAVDNVIKMMFDLFSAIRLFIILGDAKNISSTKVAIYEKHKRQLKELKEDLKQVDSRLNTNFYDEIFVDTSEKSVNYSNYVGKIIEKGIKKRTPKTDKSNRDSLIKRLGEIKKTMDDKLGENKFLQSINEEDYLQIPTNSDNRLIPYQIHYEELKQILNNFIAVSNDRDRDEPIKTKILQLMKFKVPYFVGPLSNPHQKSENYWLVKKAGMENIKITPYNIDEVVDKEATNEAFIKRMRRSCTYLDKEFCLQQETILYQTYIFYNTVNKIKVNDNYLTKENKEILFEALIKRGSLTKKTCLNLLNCKDAEITGFSKSDTDQSLKIKLSAIKKFRDIFPNQKDNEFYQSFYDDVVNLNSFIDDDELEIKRKKIKETIAKYKTVTVSDEQIEKLINVKSNKVGNLSYRFLNELKFVKNEETGEVATMVSILKDSNMNHMEVLYIANNMEMIDAENNKEYDLSSADKINEYLKNKYIPPHARRTIIQANKIVDEIIKIMGGKKPSNIAIEFTRENQVNKKETMSRYKQISTAYEQVKEECMEARKQKLESDLELGKDNLKNRRIYLYFLQLGKDLYTGEPIDFDKLLAQNSTKDDTDNSLETIKQEYDIDHIFPQSRIKDDSLNNLVLTSRVINGEKGNNYPLPRDVQEKNKELWQYLRQKNLMSSKKYDRLTRTTKLTDEELGDFVSRQKTTLDWINLETANLLKLRFAEDFNDKQFIIFSKSRHVSSFRQKLKLYKFRALNDLHHAHDAYLNIVLGKLISSKLYITSDGEFRTYNYERIIESSLKSKEEMIKDYLKNDKFIYVTKRTRINNKGAFWDEQIVSKNEVKEGQDIPTKRGLDVTKYGGYKGIERAFFSILKKGNNKIIMPIETYNCSKFYDDNTFNLQKFQKHILETYPGHEVLIPIVPIYQKVILDGKELLLVGKTGNRLTFHITTQLILDEETSYYLRRISNFQKKNSGQKIDEESLILNNILKEKNKETFNKLCQKIVLDEKLSKLYPDSTINRLKNKEEIFNKLSLKEQYESLVMIMNHLIRPNTSNVGNLFGRKYIDENKTRNIKYKFSILKESVTGYFTKKIDINV